MKNNTKVKIKNTRNTLLRQQWRLLEAYIFRRRAGVTLECSGHQYGEFYAEKNNHDNDSNNDKQN